MRVPTAPCENWPLGFVAAKRERSRQLVSPTRNVKSARWTSSAVSTLLMNVRDCGVVMVRAGGLSPWTPLTVTLSKSPRPSGALLIVRTTVFGVSMEAAVTEPNDARDEFERLD